MSTFLMALSTALLYLSLPIALALAGLGLAGLFAFGGERRNALALLAAGVYGALTGAAYLYGVLASHSAVQDNAYLGNIYLGLTLLLLGVSGLMAGGLIGAGLNRLVAISLGGVGLVGLVGVYRGISYTTPYGGRFVVVYLVAALALMTGVLALLRRADLAGAALGLGVAGAVIALGLYVVLGMWLGGGSLDVYTQFGVDTALGAKPPVLEGFGAILTLALGVVVFLVARRTGSSAGAAGRHTVSPA